MELSFELLREAGVRLPGAMGNTIGIVGGLIIGQAAVDANVFTMARPLLGLYLHYFPDDELTDLLQSLGDPRIDELLEA